MKRKKSLYLNICKYNHIKASYREVCKNTRNKRRVALLKDYGSIYTYRTYQTLVNKKYKVGSYVQFVIYEPKERQIVSQNIEDKIINHLVARYILYPAILPCLLDINVASRKNYGTRRGLELAQQYHLKSKQKYRKYYILKCDISKFFASIDHNRLKEKLLRRIKDKDAIKIVFDLIDSNSPGLFIGSMVNQILAIFYLNDLDHYIKETLKIKYYIRYQDDFLLFHKSKKYLKYCLEQIKKFLAEEKLVLNNKTRIYKHTDNFLFLGRNCKNKYARYRNVKRKLKARKFLYENGKISLNSYASTKICYKGLLKKQI